MIAGILTLAAAMVLAVWDAVRNAQVQPYDDEQ
jgi:hypothetical protein